MLHSQVFITTGDFPEYVSDQEHTIRWKWDRAT